jgi:hypothetical protein
LSAVENDRWALHQKARECFGEREGDILMEHLPPAGWSHLATKDDVALSAAVLRTEMAELRTDLKTEMAELRTELKTNMAELRTELKTDMAALRTDMHKDFRNHTWTMIAAMGSIQAFALTFLKMTS